MYLQRIALPFPPSYEGGVYDVDDGIEAAASGRRRAKTGGDKQPMRDMHRLFFHSKQKAKRVKI